MFIKHQLNYGGFPYVTMFAPDDGVGGGGEGVGDDPGAGGGGSAPPMEVSEDLQRQIDDIVNQRTAGLKANSEALKREKEKARKERDDLARRLEELGGDEGISRLREFQTAIEKNEELKLLADGEHEKVFERRTENLKRDYEGKVQSISADRDQWKQKHDEVSNKLLNLVLGTEIDEACDKAGITGAGQKRDAKNLARSLFVFDETLNRAVLREEDGSIVYGKNPAEPITIREWLEYKSGDPDFQHWWPESQRSPANGFAGFNDPDTMVKRMSTMPMDEFRRQRLAQHKANGRM